MITLAALSATISVCLAPTNSSDSLATLWQSARPYPAFYAGVNERQTQWQRVHERAAVPDDLAVRARGACRLRLLIVTVYACGDSINVVPYLAKLVELAPNLELRIAHPDQGRWLMEAHRTPDGRAATPTLVILDEQNNELGCWIERPAALQRWYLDTGRNLPEAEYVRQKNAWYDADLGASTLREVVAALEAVAAHRGCEPTR